MNTTQYTETLPSGKVITFREQNGEDDAVLTNQEAALKGVSINNFLSGIIVKDEDTGSTVSPQDIMGWKIMDKYYLLFLSRYYSIGEELEFKSRCPDVTCKHEPKSNYIEDLNIFKGDLSDPEYTPKNKYQIKKYPLGKQGVVDLTLKTGRHIRWKIMDGHGEQYFLDLEDSGKNRNATLIARNVETKNEQGQWGQVFDFRQFSKKEMGEIRASIKRYDPTFEVVSEITCPKCKLDYIESLMDQPGFLFPEEI